MHKTGHFSIKEITKIEGHANLDVELKNGKVEKCEKGGIDPTSDAVLMDGRFIWDITQRWDMDLHGGILSTDGLSENQYAAGLGLNYLVKKNLRVGGGYNVKGFREDDLDSEGYNKEGVYVGLQYKVDESSLDWATDKGKDDRDDKSEPEPDKSAATSTETSTNNNKESFMDKVKGWFSSDNNNKGDNNDDDNY